LDLRYSESDEKFRRELAAWLAVEVPRHGKLPPANDWPARRAYDCEWQRKLHGAGYAGVHWPAEYGGRGATLTEQLVYYEETARAGAPYVGANFIGMMHGGPTLMAEGTPAQKAFHLPAILRGEHVWCQGFSEPGAGSDLAGLATRAVRQGDEYVVHGHKIWSTRAHIADYCELLVRTDPDAPRHKGITWLILPMRQPGVTVRPLETLQGDTHFCEVFLDGARVPVANRVGEENDGWRVAMVTFAFERGTAFVSELLASMRLVDDLAAIAAGAGPVDASVRRELAVVRAELDAQWALTKRNVSKAQRGGTVGVGGSVFKLAYHHTRSTLGDLAMRVLGRAGLAMDDPLALSKAGLDHVEQRLYALSLSIAAGTEQIQRNIVGERMLGLPKER
jgi:alkylation response protein AidB-like acyl-CoA dehydrogenase